MLKWRARAVFFLSLDFAMVKKSVGCASRLLEEEFEDGRDSQGQTYHLDSESVIKVNLESVQGKLI